VDADIPYLLLTPGPLTTTKTVKQAMMQDYCTWDDDYNRMVKDIRGRLVRLAGGNDRYTSVLMQGSGTFTVEATLGSTIGPGDKVLIIDNGAYGSRIVEIVRRQGISHAFLKQPEVEAADADRLGEMLASDPAITHVAMVHCETTTGLLNPASRVGALAAEFGKIYILDAMSSFGGVEMDIEALGAHYLISSSNKCIQGVPGFGFVIAMREMLQHAKGRSKSLSLDIYDQWHEMETKQGKWRYTSPTHTIRAFAQALDELDREGGVAARAARYAENHRLLVDGMKRLGFQTLILPEHQSPIITSFLYPDDPRFRFETFYEAMKARRFVLYPGKVSDADTFRIGNIGHVFSDDIRQLLEAVEEVQNNGYEN